VTGPRDVDFLSGDAGPESGADVLEYGRRRRPPRWVWLVAAALVVALVVAVAVFRHGSRHLRAAKRPSTSVSVAAPPPVGSALPLASPSAALDVWASAGEVWVLQPGRLTLLDDLTSLRAAGSFTLGRADPDSRTVMVVDPAFGVLWVVVEGGTASRVLEFNAFTLDESRELTLPKISGAAALRGHLYLTSGVRLIDIPWGAAPHTVATAPAGTSLGSIAADPTRSQLLLIDYGSPTHLWIWQPGHALTLTTAPLAFAKGTIAVAHGQVWVAGYGQSGAALLHLAASANDLTPVDISPLSGGLGPGALVVASGQQVLWVRSGAGGDDLWCIDADTGRDLQHWNLDGAVTSTAGTAVIATSSGARPLHLSGCPG
jgi:hypothetical protein